MSKKITSVWVLVAAMLLSLPSNAQVQKKLARSADKQKSEMRVLNKNLKVVSADFAKQQRQQLEKIAKEKEAEGISLEAWDWAAHAPAPFVSTNGQKFTQMTALGGKAIATFKAQRDFQPNQVNTSRFAATTDSHGIITAPDEGESKLYTREGMTFSYNSSTSSVSLLSQSGSVEIVEAEDGTVYIKDIISTLGMETWVKGTKSGNTITVPGGQPVAWSTSYNTTMSVNWGNYDGGYFNRGTGDITFTVNGDVITLDDAETYDHFIGLYWDDDNSWQAGYGDYATVWTEGYEEPVWELIELPAGATTEDWYVTGTTNSGNVPATAKVAFVGNEVYVQGLFTYLPDAWVMGTKTGNSVAFPALQYLGTYGSYNIWTWAGTIPVDGSYYVLDEVTFTYDEAAKTLTLDEDQAYVATADNTRWYALDYYTELSLSANEPVVENIKAPYTSNLTSQAEFKKYTVLDNNGDGNTWTWSSSNNAYYRYSMSNQADDYLILPIELEANKNYNVTVSAAAYMSSYPEKFEVKVGKAATAEGLNITAIGPTTLTNSDYLDFDGSFTTDEAGVWYVAIHAISDPDKFYLLVKSLTIELGADPAAPAAVADFAAVAGEKGALEVNISLTAPATSIDGNALTGAEDVVIYRDDAAVKTFEGVAAGTALTWQDTDVKDGVSYTYYVQASNESGLGAKSEKVSVWVGQDMPEDIENIQVTGMPTANSISLTWDAVKGVNGGYIDADNALYSVTTVEMEEFEILPGWSWEMPVEGETLGTVTGDTKLTVDFAGLDEGELGIQYFGVKAKVGENETDATSWLAFVYTGAPYELPIEENFADKSFNYLWDYNEVTGFMVSTDASDGDGVALALTASGADGTVMMESFKLNTKAAANPTLLFDAKKGTSATDELIVYGLAPDGTKTTLQTVTLTDEYQTVKVTIPAELAKERWSKVGFNADLENGTNILLDNIKILDLYEYDLSVAVSAPKSVQAGNAATITATVKNEGENAATGYTVTIKAGEEVLVEETVSEALAPFATKEFTAEFATTIFDDAADVNIAATVEYANDLNEDNNAATAIISIKESTATPVTDVTAADNGGSVLVGWTAPDLGESSIAEITDDVESYEEFDNGGLDAENLDEHYGQIGEWTVYDGNREYGYGFNGVTVPHLGEPNAWLVMNVSSDQLSQDLSESQPAYSGNQYFISTCVAESNPIADTDHWLISPELPGVAQHISFMAREITDQYGEESFQIWYSTTDNNIESFQQHEYGFGLVVLDSWDKFEYDLPEGTKYFAIRHTSNDIFGLCIDDIQFTAGVAPLEIDHFNIYLDGEQAATAAADAATATLENVADGTHTVGVSVVYTNGQESKPVTATVTVSPATGLNAITVITKPVDVYSVDGKLVRKQTTSVDGLKGVYVVDGKKVVLQ